MRVLFLLFFLINTQASASESFDKDNFEQKKSVLSKMVNEDCLGLIPLGVCPKAKHLIGALVLLREPSLLIETIKKSSGKSASNLQFNEVRVMNNPAAKALHQAICSDLPDTSSLVFYISEADFLEWRRGAFEKNTPEGIKAPLIGSQCREKPVGYENQCMNTWGTLYPRTGFNITSSAAVASAISAVRAVSIAKNPGPTHIVGNRLNYSFQLEKDKLQMIQPKLALSCISIGDNPKDWDIDKTSKDGKYVWAYWNWRLCCI